MAGKVLVIGSSNTDMVIKTHHFPKPGETILGGKFFMNPGGKGANQAVAAARLGAKVTFVGKVGNDIFGRQAIQGFESEGIDTQYVVIDKDHPSGVALITVDQHGENCIVVAQGANMQVTPFDFTKLHAVFEQTDVVLMQLETPIETISFCAKLAKKAGKRVILNPAPAAQLPDEIYPNIYLITPNQVESEILTGVTVNSIDKASEAAEILIKKGIQHVMITLGSQGVYVHTAKHLRMHIPGVQVDAVDTTAAGDVFNGAIAAALAEGKDWEEAATFACKAASISVTRMGAQASAPYRKEVLS